MLKPIPYKKLPSVVVLADENFRFEISLGAGGFVENIYLIGFEKSIGKNLIIEYKGKDKDGVDCWTILVKGNYVFSIKELNQKARILQTSLLPFFEES